MKARPSSLKKSQIAARHRPRTSRSIDPGAQAPKNIASTPAGSPGSRPVADLRLLSSALDRLAQDLKLQPSLFRGRELSLHGHQRGRRFLKGLAIACVERGVSKLRLQAMGLGSQGCDRRRQGLERMLLVEAEAALAGPGGRLGFARRLLLFRRGLG